MARYLEAGGRHVMTAPSALGMLMDIDTPLAIKHGFGMQSSCFAGLHLLSLWQ